MLGSSVPGPAGFAGPQQQSPSGKDTQPFNRKGQNAALESCAVWGMYALPWRVRSDRAMADVTPLPGAFLQACSGKVPRHTPVWLMRQAGRILPGYRQLRQQYGSVGTLFDTPELAARITLMPVEQLGVDAAILFTDLVTPLAALGVSYRYEPGPILDRPIRSRSDLHTIGQHDVQAAVGNVIETVGLVCAALPQGVPLIGYAGAPFTLAAWLVEGRGTREVSVLREMLYADAALARTLLQRLTDLIADFLFGQIRAGAQAVQLFDTSVGVLGPELYGEFAQPYVRQVFDKLAPTGVPRIYFPLAAPHLLPLLASTGADVLSMDWRTPLDAAYARLGADFPLQGNLDPCALFAPPLQLDRAIDSVLEAARHRPHVFNLGHGVLPNTPLHQVVRLVKRVHEHTAGQNSRQSGSH